MNMVHTFAICAYGESPYLEECIQSLLNQKTESKILIATSTPNSQILEMGEKYDIPIFVNYLEKGLAGDWNFAYNCANTPLVTLAGRPLLRELHRGYSGSSKKVPSSSYFIYRL